MQLDWTPAGESLVTLGDDADDPRRTVLVEQFGGACLVQSDMLYEADNPALEARGNVSGQFVATVTQSFETVDDASVFMGTEYGRIGQKGDLAWTRAATLFTFTDAVLQSVTVAEINGVKIVMRYAWVIGALEVSE